MGQVSITLPDGSTKSYESGVTPLEVANSIGKRLAEAAIVATFSNFNGGAPREHLRVAILAAGSVALVDVSASSPEAFQRNWPSVSRLLNSLYVE